jgi:D-alanine--poly(phosphoribitol) ligase subunit 1
MNNVIDFIKNTSIRYKNNIAVSQNGDSLSYALLISKAYDISLEISLDKKKPVAIFLPKSIDALASIVATTMSGNIYCPVDVLAPDNRLEMIIESLGLCTIITNSKFKAKLDKIDSDKIKYDVINIDEITTKNIAIENIWGNLESQLSKVIDTDPCYIIFTSGSTGVPKGVTISHRNVIDYIEWANNTYEVNEFDIVGSQSPLFFDNSTLDLYICFSNGACLNLIPESTFIFPKKIIDYLDSENITTIFWVPSLLITIANFDLLSNKDLPKLRNVFFAGEVMPAKQMKYWLRNHPNAHYSNLYGPTEITVDCTYFDVPADWDGDVLPIGIPCLNTDVLILDENNSKASSGELCVRGSGVALGYWGDVEKTSKVFVQNPLNSSYRDIIYRTGDLVNVVDGLIYFVGRKDHQIKHNGYRIELGEIEAVISGLDHVRVCVAGYIHSEKLLYVMVQNTNQLNEFSLRKSLVDKMPKYMIPNKIIFVDTFPLTPNGKVDRLKINNQVEELLLND